MFRRNSHSTTSGGGTKAESKLRNVLTAIGESRTPSKGSNGSEKDAESPDTPTNPEFSSGINGLTRSASDKLGQTFGGDGGGRVGSWSHDSSDPGDESESETGLTTPRRSTVFIPTSSSPPSPTLKGHDRDASKTPTAESVALQT